MRCVHFSGREMALKDAKACARQTGGHSLFKPQGLWFSDEEQPNGWLDWCVGEEFRLETLAHAYEFNLSGANLLVLKSPEEAVDFTLENLKKDAGYPFPAIDWDVPREKYDGILLSPYHRRIFWEGSAKGHSLMELMTWFGTIDAASGCVWNPDVIENWRELPQDDPVFAPLRELRIPEKRPRARTRGPR